MSNNYLRIGGFLLMAVLLTGGSLMAQPFNLDERVQPVELNFTEYKKEGDEKAKGRISINTLTQEKDTMYYFIKGLSMYSPTYFSLNATDPGAHIKVNLCKENWHNFHQAGDVKGKEIWKSKFKTEGDFGIRVVANKKPTRYVLLVWTGNEMTIEMPAVFKSAQGATANGEGWFVKNRIVLVIGAVALLAISFLLFKLKKKQQ
jgi:hypothetical protein